MMIVKRPVGAWEYRLENNIFNDDLSDGRLDQFKRDVVRCLTILESHELLFDLTLTTDRLWVGHKGEVEGVYVKKNYRRQLRKAQCIKLKDKEDFSSQLDLLMLRASAPSPYKIDTLSEGESVDHLEEGSKAYAYAEHKALLPAFRIFGDNEFCLYPNEIYIHGKGMLFDADGNKQEYPDVVCLELDLSVYEPMLQVSTLSMAWLPRNIQGEDQTAISEYNAPRLEAALNELDTFLVSDNEVNEDQSNEDLPFAYIEGNRLKNIYYDLMDGQDEPDFQKMDEYGRLLSVG